MYYIGQSFGLLAMICNLTAPLLKKKEHMLFDLALLNFFTMLNFLLIGKYGSAVWLYVVAILQTGVSYLHVKKNTSVRSFEAALFFFLYVALGLFGIVTVPGFTFAWSGALLLEFVPILGSVLSMITIFVRSEQVTRIFVLLTSVVWMVYSGIVGAAAFFSDGACVVTTLIALFRYRKTNTQGR